MHKTNTRTQRMLWLFTNELRMKKNQYLLILISAFAILTYLFFNSTFSIAITLDNLINPRSVFPGSSASFFGDSSKLDLKYHLDFFPTALLIVGSIITSLSFIEYHSESHRRFHISLPAHSFEKWAVKGIWCVFLFPILFLCLYHLFALVTYSWGADMNKEYVKISFFDPYIWSSVRTHVLLQSGLFMAATFFRKYAAIKALLVAIAVYFFIAAEENLLVYSFFPDYDLSKMGGFFSPDGWRSYLINEQLNVQSLNKVYPTLFNSTTYSILIGLAFVVALYVSYCKFTEYEA